MARLVERFGPCAMPLRRVPGGHFAALARSILYQQLAGRAAFAIHGRFLALFEEATPTAEAVVAIKDGALRGPACRDRRRRRSATWPSAWPTAVCASTTSPACPTRP